MLVTVLAREQKLDAPFEILGREIRNIDSSPNRRHVDDESLGLIFQKKARQSDMALGLPIIAGREELFESF